MDASFKSVLARIDRSLVRNERSLEDVRAQRKALVGRLEVPYRALDRRLEAHEQRVEGIVRELIEQRKAVAELVARSPELPLDSAAPVVKPKR